MTRHRLFLTYAMSLALLLVSSQAISGPIKSRHVDIWSDGTRLSGDLFFPPAFNIEAKFPVVILCNGWH